MKTAGIFYTPGDIFSPRSVIDFDRANYTFPQDEHQNNSRYVFQVNKTPALLDNILGKGFLVDGHDYRSGFNWITEHGYNWVITDTSDLWANRLERQGRRNVTYLLADGKEVANKILARGWHKRDRKN